MAFLSPPYYKKAIFRLSIRIELKLFQQINSRKMRFNYILPQHPLCKQYINKGKIISFLYYILFDRKIKTTLYVV